MASTRTFAASATTGGRSVATWADAIVPPAPSSTAAARHATKFALMASLPALVIVARQPLRLHDPLVGFRALEDRAAVHLTDERPLDLLPRGLRGWKRVAAGRFDLGAPLDELFVADAQQDFALAEVEAQPVAGADQRQRPARGRFG